MIMSNNEPNFDKASQALHAWVDDLTSDTKDEASREVIQMAANISAKAAMIALHAAFSDEKPNSDQ